MQPRPCVGDELAMLGDLGADIGACDASGKHWFVGSGHDARRHQDKGGQGRDDPGAHALKSAE